MTALASCFDWRAYVGAAAVGLGVWLVAPTLIWTALPLLMMAACVSSMLPMARAMRSGGCAVEPAETTRPASVVVPPEDQVVELTARLASVGARRAAIAREIAELESASVPVSGSAVREAEEVARAADSRLRGSI